MIKFKECIIDKFLERRVCASKIVKPEDLVISNASLEDIKRGMNKIYDEIYGNQKDKENNN